MVRSWSIRVHTLEKSVRPFTWHCHFTCKFHWNDSHFQAKLSQQSLWSYHENDDIDDFNYTTLSIFPCQRIKQLCEMIIDWRVVLGFCNFEGYIFYRNLRLLLHKIRKKIFDHTWLYEQKPWRNWANTKPGLSICSGMWTWYTFRKFWTNKARVRAQFRSKKSYTLHTITHSNKYLSILSPSLPIGHF